jgi:HEAT repeat protein
VQHRAPRTLARLKPITAMLSDEKTLLATLASDAGTEEKARACRQLAIVGGPASVPALAALLGDEKLSSHARSGLENIKDAAAGEALNSALPGLRGRLLASAVVSLGVRRETSAVPALFKLAGSTDPDLMTAAVSSLGRIASPEAVEKIRFLLTDGRKDQRLAAAHAAIAAAGKLDPAAASALMKAVRAADVPARIKEVAGSV